jgi:hypothetical protein
MPVRSKLRTMDSPSTDSKLRLDVFGTRGEEAPFIFMPCTVESILDSNLHWNCRNLWACLLRAGLHQISIDEFRRGSYKGSLVLFNFRFQYVKRRFVFFDPGFDNCGLIDFDRKKIANDHPGRHCDDTMGKEAVGHCRIQQQRCDPAMQKSGVSLIELTACEFGLNSFVISNYKFKLKS